ncbi:MAG: hypothetical protein ACYDH5_17295 [Acidimicrobiales bacterium]
MSRAVANANRAASDMDRRTVRLVPFEIAERTVSCGEWPRQGRIVVTGWR